MKDQHWSRVVARYNFTIANVYIQEEGDAESTGGFAVWYGGCKILGPGLFATLAEAKTAMAEYVKQNIESKKKELETRLKVLNDMLDEIRPEYGYDWIEDHRSKQKTPKVSSEIAPGVHDPSCLDCDEYIDEHRNRE